MANETFKKDNEIEPSLINTNENNTSKTPLILNEINLVPTNDASKLQSQNDIEKKKTCFSSFEKPAQLNVFRKAL